MQHKPLTEDELYRLVSAEFDAAEEWSEELSDERTTALDMYTGRPLGDEVDGRSQVVSSDVADVIEWLMPNLVRTVAGDDELVAFEGFDDEQAKQATQLVTHVFWSQNDGFRLHHDCLKDGLLSKTGAMKWRWCEKAEPIDRDYRGLSEMELAMLLQDLQARASGAEVSVIGQEVIQAADGSVTFNVKIRVMRRWGQVEIETIPPEELRIPRSARVVDDTCRYVAHDVPTMTRSDLVAMGMDLAMVLDLPKREVDIAEERHARMGSVIDESPVENKMMEPVEYIEHYVLADVDGDGIAERRLVVTSGSKIIRNELIAGLPIAVWSPVRMPHSAIGRSIADRIVDIQRVMTALLRGTLDNIYTVNAGGRHLVQNNTVNLDDLLTARPNGVVRTKDINGHRSLPVEFIGDKTNLIMEMVRGLREERSGVNRHNQGINAESLHQTATGAMAVIEQGEELKELLVRLYAEFVVKRVYKGVLDLLVRYQDSAMQILVSGKKLEVDPSKFSHGFGLRVKVGSGNMRRKEKAAALANILSSQAEALKGGLPIVNIDGIYKATADLTELVGFRPERYWVDPSSPEGQAIIASQQQKRPETNPLVEAEMVKSRARMAEAAQQDQFDRTERAMDHAEKMTELSLKHGVILPGSIL